MRDFELKFLGIGAFANPVLKNTSAFFVNGSDLVLFDSGETVFVNVKKILDLPKIKRVLILITHLHNDHAGSLSTLISYCQYILKKPVEIFHPSSEIKKYLDVTGTDPNIYTLHFDAPKNWGIEITAHEVLHIERMKCFGYEITTPYSCFYYSGDANDIPQIVLEKFLSEKIQTMYHEVFVKNNSSAHCPLSRLEEKIPAQLRHKVFCMHIPEKKDIRVIKSKGFRVPRIFR